MYSHASTYQAALRNIEGVFDSVVVESTAAASTYFAFGFPDHSELLVSWNNLYGSLFLCSTLDCGQHEELPQINRNWMDECE